MSRTNDQAEAARITLRGWAHSAGYVESELEGAVEVILKPILAADRADRLPHFDGEGSVTISGDEYGRLLDRDRDLTSLEIAGVDNWEGYEQAGEIYREMTGE